jgi:choloylglycine hydrolase
MARDGAAGPRSVRWTSRHGSIVASLYEVATVDGMNDAGLVANTLYLVESDYGTPRADQPTMSIAAWTQYVLDQYATVAEAVTALRAEPFAVIAPTLPNGSPAHGHMALSDPSGDSAVLEYVGGKLVVHHGRQYQVMTNSPTFDQQLALNAYWEQIGGMTMLPGTVRAADRFARAAFFVSALPPTDDPARAVASVVSVLRAVSVPLGLSVPGKPDVASTIWRTFYDQKAKTVYWDSATSPTIFWVPMADVDLKAGAPVKKLTLAGGRTYGGNAAAAFAPATPFPFLPATTP